MHILLNPVMDQYIKRRGPNKIWTDAAEGDFERINERPNNIWDLDCEKTSDFFWFQNWISYKRVFRGSQVLYSMEPV